MPITAILQGIASALTFWKNNKKEIEEVKQIFEPQIDNEECLILLTMAIYDSNDISVEESYKTARRCYVNEKEMQLERYLDKRREERQLLKRKLEEDDGN